MYQRYNQAGHTVAHALANKGCVLSIIGTIVNREEGLKMNISLKNETSEYNYLYLQNGTVSCTLLA